MTSHRREYSRKRKKKRVKMVLELFAFVAFSLLHVKKSPCNPTLVNLEWV